MADRNFTHKICTRCKVVLPLSDFNRNKSKPDGLSTECKQCVLAYNRAYYAANTAKCNQNSRAYYAANPEKVRASAKRWSDANPEKVALYRSAWRIRNPEKIAELSRLDWLQHCEKRRAGKAAWRKANPARCAQHVRARQARLLEAMPAWADPDEILKFYAAAKMMQKLTGEKWHVDHYYPLRGKLVCGLHVPANLRVIQAHINQSKSNRHPVEC